MKFSTAFARMPAGKTARLARLVFAAFFALCLSGLESEAHRVNIFAFVSGDEVKADCFFSRSQKVRHGQVRALDAATGQLLHEGLTSERGEYAFRPPQDFLRSGHDLLLILNAGEGHRSQWTMSGADLAGLRAPTTFAGAPGPEGSMAPEPGPAEALPTAEPRAHTAPPARPDHPAAGPGHQTGPDMEVLLGRVLDEKLAPIHRALGEMQSREPDLRDIVGGLGWILGLLGLAAYLKYARSGRHG